MALKDRASECIGGPDGQGTWYDNGWQFQLQNHSSVSATTTLNRLPAGIVPTPHKVLPGGQGNPDILVSGGSIQSIAGVQVVLSAALAAQGSLTLTQTIWRAGAQVGGGPAFGWQAGGGGTPAFSAWTPVLMPVLSTNTAFITYPLGSLILLQPSDVFTVEMLTTAGSVVIPVGMLQAIQV